MTGNTTDFSYRGGVQEFTVQTTGLYEITADGAQGGSGYSSEGLGAEISGEVKLTAGEMLTSSSADRVGATLAGVAVAAAPLSWRSKAAVRILRW